MTEAVEQTKDLGITEPDPRYSVNTVVTAIGYVDRKLTQVKMEQFEDVDARCLQHLPSFMQRGSLSHGHMRRGENWGNIGSGIYP